MPTPRKRAKEPGFSVALKAIAEQLGMPIKDGTVTASRDRFYVTVGPTKREIPVGEMIDAKDLRPLVGRHVAVVVSGRNILALEDPLSRRPIRILCYIPAPDLLNRVRPAIRAALLDAYVKQGLIEASVGRKLAAAQGLGQ